MSRLEKLGVVCVAVIAGLVGGLVSGGLINLVPEANAAEVVREHPKFQITSGDGRNAYVVNDFGEVFLVIPGAEVQKLGQCKSR